LPFVAIEVKNVSQIQTHTCVFVQSMDSNDGTFEMEKDVTARTYTGGFLRLVKVNEKAPKIGGEILIFYRQHFRSKTLTLRL